MRALILGLVVVAALVLAFAFAAPDRFDAIGQGGVAQLVYLLCLLLLVGAGGARAAAAHDGRGPGPLGSLLIWGALLALVALAYRAAWIWAGLINLAAGFMR